MGNNPPVEECKCDSCAETTIYARGYCEECFDQACDQGEGHATIDASLEAINNGTYTCVGCPLGCEGEHK